MKICLDPGHYGSNFNPGITAGYVESNFTWAYYLLMRGILESKYGIEVVGTRDCKEDYPKKPNGDDDLQERGKRSKGCDLFISIHSNAAVDELTKKPKPEINSVFTHWSVRSGGKELACKIGEILTEFFREEWGDCQDPTMYAVESKKYPGYDYYGVLKGAAKVEVPAIIVEHSFHTNPRYCEWAMVEGNIDRMAEVECDAIAEFYGIKPIEQGNHYCIVLNQNLEKGDRGEAVKLFQIRMRQVSPEFDKEVEAHSFKKGYPDGSFGAGMVQTLKKFQENAGIAQTGTLNDITRQVLNSDIGKLYGQLTSTDNMLQRSNEKIKFAKQTLA